MHRFRIETPDEIVVATGVVVKTEAVSFGRQLAGYWVTPDPAWAVPSTLLRSTPGEVVDGLLSVCEELEIADVRWIWEE